LQNGRFLKEIWLFLIIL